MGITVSLLSSNVDFQVLFDMHNVFRICHVLVHKTELVSKMRSVKTLATLFLGALIQFSAVASISMAAETLLKTDFAKESFAKTIDFFDYVRAHATLNGYQPHPKIGTPTFTQPMSTVWVANALH